jgi:hypothetical protein
VVGVLGRDDPLLALGFSCRRVGIFAGHAIKGSRFALEHPGHGGGAQVQARPGKRLGDLDLAHRGAKRLQTLDYVMDKLRELVDRLGQLHEGIGASANHDGTDQVALAQVHRESKR